MGDKETVAHILNGCSHYKGLYIARHDRLVDMVSDKIREVQERTTKMYKHSTVKLDWFDHNDTHVNSLQDIPNTPDIVFINENRKTATIFEIGCPFDLYMDTCFTSKLMKYQPLVERIMALGYNCQLIILVFGSLGHVHKLVLRGLQLGGLQKTNAKKLAKYCSVSAIIGSLSIWRRRCFIHLFLISLILKK